MERYRDYRDIVSFEKNELEEYLKENGYPAFRSKQIYEWVHKKLASSYEDLSNLPKKLREELAGYYHVLPLEIKEKIVSKLDGTAKGGIAVAIQSELDIPVKYIGVGESIDDLQKFDANSFVDALFDIHPDEN